jgi:hypothetical protein
MNSQTYHRLRTTTTRAWRLVAGAPGQRGRARMIIVAGAATVLAIGAGVGWGLAGDGGQPGAARVANGAPGGDSSGVPGGAGNSTGGDQPDGAAATDPAGDGGLPGTGGAPGGSGSSSGLGNGPQAPGGGAAENRPPVIEDAGLSSDGLTLTVAPTVTDPDGDPVTVGIELAGTPVATDADGTARVTFDPADGYQQAAAGRVVATDSHGAAVEQSFTETLRAVTEVELRDVQFEVTSAASCFANEPAHRLTGSLQFYDAVRRTVQVSQELRPNRPRVTLLEAESAELVGTAPVLRVLLLSGSLADGRDVLSQVHRAGDTGRFRHDLFDGGSCRGVLSYQLSFDTR